MTDSLLTEIINRAVARSVATTLDRRAEAFAEKLAAEAWADPAFRERIKVLMEAAFEQVLADLSRPRPAP